MDEKDDGADPGPDHHPFANESSSWPADPQFSDVNDFFAHDRESTILSEFGWNLNPERDRDRRMSSEEASADMAGTRVFLAPPESSSGGGGGAMQGTSSGGGCGGGGGSSAVSNPSVSSSSHEDPAEKSTGSGDKPPEIPSANKERKKGQKRIRQPRFAFMTKSEVDHLEDGYRWRKYGQKAVKNSPFPRSYYRCTNSKCTVKKRVERSYEDPAVVVTTYEGQHCHHTVGFQRGGAGLISHEAAAFASHFTPPFSQFYYTTTPGSSNIHSPAVQDPLPPMDVVVQSQQNDHEAPESSPITPEATLRITPPAPATDEGLLGDMVPPGVRRRREQN